MSLPPVIAESSSRRMFCVATTVFFVCFTEPVSEWSPLLRCPSFRNTEFVVMSRIFIYRLEPHRYATADLRCKTMAECNSDPERTLACLMLLAHQSRMSCLGYLRNLPLRCTCTLGELKARSPC